MSVHKRVELASQLLKLSLFSKEEILSICFDEVKTKPDGLKSSHALDTLKYLSGVTIKPRRGLQLPDYLAASCCPQPSIVYIGTKFTCETCGKDEETRNAAISTDPFYQTPRYQPKCECGADKTYGPGNGLHSATMPCPLFKTVGK